VHGNTEIIAGRKGAVSWFEGKSPPIRENEPHVEVTIAGARKWRAKRKTGNIVAGL